MKALIIGATGATGKDLVNKLLEDNDFVEVLAFVRRPLNIDNSKLKSHVVNFDCPKEWRELVTGDIAFSCLGTTLKDAGSKEAQKKVDYDYQYNFAKAAKENGVQHFILVSAYGANGNSPIFYPKMKGELEEAVEKLNFDALTIFQPGMLDRKNSTRTMEVVGAKAIKAVTSLGLLKKYRPLPTQKLAEAMCRIAKSPRKGLLVIKLDEIFRFAE